MTWGEPAGDEPRLSTKVALWVVVGFVTPAVFLGLSKRGEPIYEDALLLLVPGGVALMVLAVLLRKGLAIGLAVFGSGLGVAGLGMEYADPDRPWSVLAIPMITLVGLLFLREAWRGKRSKLLGLAGDRWQRLVAHAGAWMFGLAWPLFVLWTLGIVEFD